jgi:hypothetical protein
MQKLSRSNMSNQANTQPLLTRDMIRESDTALWRLFLRINPARLDVLLLGPESVETSVIFHSVELGAPNCQALEEAIYDNPLLLSDFGQVIVTFDTANFALIPAECVELKEEIARTLMPSERSADDFELFGVETGVEQLMMVRVERDVMKFLRRTFAQATYGHVLAVDVTYLNHVNQNGDCCRTYGLCTAHDELAVVSFRPDGRACYINGFTDVVPDDVAYYMLAARSQAGGGQLVVGGELSRRNAASEALRRVESEVLPITLSEDLLQLCRMAPQAPLDLLFATQL